MKNKNLIIFSLFLIFLLSSPLVLAELKYTREKSEELFHLINWQDYAPEAFTKALEEQKPIFLMISAPSWCYWCHVYESEDYLYHPELYPYINENFIPIFVDSDKRPDITRKYLEGGWPSTTIFSPDFRRITGFVGPRDSLALLEYFKELIDSLKEKSFTQIAINLDYKETTPRLPEKNELSTFENSFLKYAVTSYDAKHGGFLPGKAQEWRQAQKFPKGFLLKFLLEKYEALGDDKYLEMVQNTFKNQYTDISKLETEYRLFDPIEGGFHRYSTNKDWSGPHYEKMLHDQSKLLLAYGHLLKINETEKTRFAVNSTASFVIDRLYDPAGGFYSSQDAYLEAEYYGLTRKEREKFDSPYIDNTRRIDSNSMMISTFLYLNEIFGNSEYEAVAKKSLEFMRQNLIGDDGAYVYFDHEKNKAFLTGQSIANSWAMLAFLKGYESLNDQNYLNSSMQIADYSLRTLYDWNSGGFFERNTKDAKFYAPNELIDLSKPYQENAVYSYAFLKLYSITEKTEYLEAGLKTLGQIIKQGYNLDDSYYLLKAIELAQGYNLLDIYSRKQKEIDTLVDKRKKDFFLNDLINAEQEIPLLEDMPQLKNEFANVGFLVLALLAFFAGTLSFLSPCTLPVLSAYFANNINSKKGEVFKNTLFFFLGLAFVFSVLGMGATLIGSFFRENRLLFTKFAGTIIIVFGMLIILGKGFSGLHLNFRAKNNTARGSFLFGSVFAIGWSACIGPILASLLLLSATSGTLLKGSSLLFIYSLGLALPLMIVSIYFDRIKNKKIWAILRGKEIHFSLVGRTIYLHSTQIISGLIFIIIGILIFNDYLFQLNQLALQSDYAQEIIIKGEYFLKNLLIK